MTEHLEEHGKDRELRARGKAAATRAAGAHLDGLDADRPAIPPSVAAVLALQRSVGNAGVAGLLGDEDERERRQRSPVHDAIVGSGQALDPGTRSVMERHLGADFSDVRLHRDAGSADSVGAAAYTVGNDIVVHPDRFQAGTPAAQRTLAHELTHVVQQRSGPVSGDEAPGGIRVSDPGDRFEVAAEHSASTVMSSIEDERRREDDEVG